MASVDTALSEHRGYQAGDAGNDTNWGQVLVGNVSDRVSWEEHAFSGETCYLAPAPTLQRPDLLTAVSTRPPDVDCAAALNLTDQNPTINQMMASLVLQLVRRMVAGTCPFMATRLDGRQYRGVQHHLFGVPSPYRTILRHGDCVAHHDLLDEGFDEGFPLGQLALVQILAQVLALGGNRLHVVQHHPTLGKQISGPLLCAWRRS